MHTALVYRHQAMKHSYTPICFKFVFFMIANGISVAFMPFHLRNLCSLPPSAVTSRHQQRTNNSIDHDKKTLYLSKKGDASTFSENEFSRTVQPERILKTKRDYGIFVEASEDECKALALRFDLGDISKLQAWLSLRQEQVGGSSLALAGIEVEGTLTAAVTQTCVRTNEKFQVDLEYPLYCIVRPITSESSSLESDDEATSSSTENAHFDKSSSKKMKANYRQQQNRKLDEMDMAELQRLLQEEISGDDNDLMEDASIYPVGGLLDVGELVAQLFWFKLDPYPKKPGTDPVSFSITG